jgi:hypothetical protein
MYIEHILFREQLFAYLLMPPSPQSEDLADVSPWDPEAKEFAQWHDDSVEDCFGRYQFTSNPFV